MNSIDKARFAQLVEPHFDVLFRTALRLTRNTPDAEDLVQDACLKAATRLTDLSSVEDRCAWLLRVQYRIFVDARRRQLRSPVRLFESTMGESADAAAEGPAPDEFVDGIASRECLNRAWDKLDRDQRALLALHAEGYDLAEIAAITGIAKQALSARLYRARSRLAKAIRGGPAIGFAVNRLES